MAYQKRKYKLVNLDNGKEIILDGTGTNYEPKNWDSSDREFKRSTKNFSTSFVYSKNLEFTGSGAEFLKSAYDFNGVEANVKMYEYRYDNPNDWEYVFLVGDFDFSEYTREKHIVKVPFNSGGLNSLLKAKLNDKFELNRETSITGETITPVTTNEFAVINRPLFLDSLSNTEDTDKNSTEIRFSAAGGASIDFYYSLPSSIIYQSDTRFVSSLVNQSQTNNSTGLSAFLFYFNNDIQKTFNLDIDLQFLIKTVTINNISNSYFKVSLVRYSDGENLSFLNETILLNSVSAYNLTDKYVDIKYNEDITLLKDESLALIIRGGANFGGFTPSPPLPTFGFYHIDITNISNKIRIQENSVRNDLPRRAKFAFNKNVGKSLLSIINNDGTTYKSDFFENSDFKLTGVTTGKLIRGFSDTTITTSLKEFLDNSYSLFNMGYNFEVVNGKETLVHEPLKHFFRPETVIKITEQVNNIKRSVAKEFIYNTIKSGYKKPSGDNLYEEVNGLNEFNTSNEYITPITRVISDYDIESPYRADSEGKELTLRKSIKIFPTEDYRTDKTIFNLDLKNIGTNVYAERTWQDDYTEEPKNIFSPETATGLRLTPFRNMQRHFWFLNSSFTKFTDKYIRYSNTRGNSDLITKKSGEIEKNENGDFQINTLENAIFVSEWIEFEYPLNSELLNNVYGFTRAGNRNIPNTYFKIEFINEFNKKEYGYLFNLKPDKEGKWKILKAL